MKTNPKLLALVQLPPPVHGSAVMNKIVIESKELNECYNISTIPLNFVKNISELGSITWYKILKMIIVVLKIFARIIKSRPSLVYFTIAPSKAAFYRDFIFVLILKVFRLNIVYHLHGRGIRKTFEANWINKILLKFAFHNVNVIILSKQLHQDISCVYKLDPYVVNNGLPNGRREIKKIIGSKPIVLYLSTISESKGVLDLINAIELIKDNAQFECRIVGSESSNLTLSQVHQIINKKGLENIIKLVGAKYGKEKFEEFNSADIFVFPTYYENEAFPLVIIEAMQYGLPVISTNIGGIPDLVDDANTGFIVEPRDLPSLSNRIRELLNDERIREKMGKAGRDKYLTKYTLETFESNMKDTIKSILSKSNKT